MIVLIKESLIFWGFYWFPDTKFGEIFQILKEKGLLNT
jgi:hypothetical protein